MDSLPAERSQQGDAALTLFAVALFPCIQQVVIIARLIGEMEIFVTVGSWEDSLKRMATRQFVFGHDQTPNIVGRKIFENGR
jgi:hypothetical protein